MKMSSEWLFHCCFLHDLDSLHGKKTLFPYISRILTGIIEFPIWETETARQSWLCVIPRKNAASYGLVSNNDPSHRFKNISRKLKQDSFFERKISSRDPCFRFSRWLLSFSIEPRGVFFFFFLQAYLTDTLEDHSPKIFCLKRLRLNPFTIQTVHQKHQPSVWVT